MHARAYKPRKVVFGGFGVGLDLIPGETLRASRARQRVSLPASKVIRRAREDLPESENHDETEKHGRVARDDRHGRPALRKKQLEHPCIYPRNFPPPISIQKTHQRFLPPRAVKGSAVRIKNPPATP